MHEHGDDVTWWYTGVYLRHEHDGGDRPHTHPELSNPYVNPPPDWPG